MPDQPTQAIDAVSTPPELELEYGVLSNTITNAAQRGDFLCRKTKAGKGRTAGWLIDIEDFKRWLAQRNAKGQGRKKANS